MAQIPRFAKFCDNILRRVRETLFPLNPSPPGLSALLRSFQHREQIQDIVRVHLAVDARDALALVHSHLPEADLPAIARGPPDEGIVGMRPYYSVADNPAEVIANWVRLKSDRELQSRRAFDPLLKEVKKELE